MVETILGIVLLVMALFLIIAVLLQSGKDSKLSGAIAGGSDSFFGGSRAKAKDKILSRLTTIVAIVFAILVLVMYLIV